MEVRLLTSEASKTPALNILTSIGKCFSSVRMECGVMEGEREKIEEGERMREN